MADTYEELYNEPGRFAIRVGRSTYVAWETSGRWYYHRRAGGNITDTNSYASRRSCRRAILNHIARTKKEPRKRNWRLLGRKDRSGRT